MFVLALLGCFVQRGWAQDWQEVSSQDALKLAIKDGVSNIRLSGDITLSSHLNISSGTTLTIDLNGHELKRSLSQVDANGNVIRIASDATLTIQDGSGDNSGRISGGFAADGGGIYNGGNLFFKGGTITNCKVDHDGGAITNHGTIIMSGGLITGCQGADCGGIFNHQWCTLVIEGGTISDCRSTAGGGAVVNKGNARISNCTFAGNTATTRSGAIWNNNTLSVDQCSFTGNKATGNDGGALHLDGGTATLKNVTINDNESVDAGGIYVASSAGVE